MKNLLLALLALVTVGLGILAWQQNRQIAALAQNATQLTAERDGLRQSGQDAAQRLATAEKSRADLETAVKDLRSRPATAQTPASRPRTPAAALAALDNPAIQRVMAASLKSTLDQRYAGLFRQLRLSPADLDKFKDLLTEKSMSGLDAVRVAQAQGTPTSPHDMESIMNKVQAEMDDSIHTLLGDQGFQQFQDYGRNIASYTLLDQIDRRLSYTNAPLQPAQSDALLHILEQTTQPPPSEHGPANTALSGFAQGVAGSNPMIASLTQRPMTDATIAAAQEVLAASQVEALKQLRAEQQMQASLLRSMRAGAGSAGGAVTSPGPGAPPTEPPPSH